MRSRGFIALVVVGLGVRQADWAIWYVKASGTGNGTSWQNAGSLQYALAQGRAQSGDEIWVVAGTYVPDPQDRNATFLLRYPNLSLYGGFAGTETAREQRDPSTNVTILTGARGSPDPNDNIKHIVTAPCDAAVIDGFTITAGYVDYSESAVTCGSGILIGIVTSPVTATIRNCQFQSNFAAGQWVPCYGGGGALCAFTTGLALNDCDFVGNSSLRDGGALYIQGPAQVAGCAFVSNISAWGGAVRACHYGSECTIEFDSCVFSLNQAAGDTTSNQGGAVHLGGDSASIYFRDCLFSNNAAVYPYSAYPGEARGCALAGETTAFVQIADCQFSSNYCYSEICEGTTDGGAIALTTMHLRVERSSFVDNAALSPSSRGVNGGAIFLWATDAHIADCLFETNRAWNGGAVSASADTLSVLRCAFFGNVADGADHGCSRGGALDIRLGAGARGDVANCLFVENSTASSVLYCSAFGGAVASNWSEPYSLLSLINCTMVFNTATGYGGGVGQRSNQTAPALANCIIWANSPNQIGADSYSPSPVVTYSCVQGGWPGAGNISSNPNLDAGFAPQAGSPVIDAGNNHAIPFEASCTDLGAAPRLMDDPQTTDTGAGSCRLVDIGVYEFSGITQPARGDSNCDGFVGFGDINAFNLALTNQLQWESQYACGYLCVNDVNLDGDVSFDDIGPFVLVLGGGCP